IVASMLENLPEAHSVDLLRRGIVPIHGIVEAFDAAEAAAFIGGAWQQPITSPLWGGRAEGTGGGNSRAEAPPPLAPPHKGEGNSRIQPSEAAAKAMLRQAGLPVPNGLEASSTDEAVAAAHELGFPVALKALGVAHKSELGAVVLNLRDEGPVREAAHRLIGMGTGLYVERMVQGGVAELIVGFTRDPVFGPTMTLSSGGVLVELLKDSATVLLPATRGDVEGALRGLKLFPLLDGYRGRGKADLAAALDAIAGIAAFVGKHADTLEELDINPLIVCAEGQGAWIADALLVLEEKENA